MKRIALLLFAVAVMAGVVAGRAQTSPRSEQKPAARSAKAVRGASPYIEIKNVDDLPWWWADPSNVNTIDLAGMPPGPHTIRIELVNANHELFPGQSETVTFTIPKRASSSGAHSHSR